MLVTNNVIASMPLFVNIYLHFFINSNVQNVGTVEVSVG